VLAAEAFNTEAFAEGGVMALQLIFWQQTAIEQHSLLHSLDVVDELFMEHQCRSYRVCAVKLTESRFGHGVRDHAPAVGIRGAAQELIPRIRAAFCCAEDHLTAALGTARRLAESICDLRWRSRITHRDGS
jgi:hypothetical protein